MDAWGIFQCVIPFLLFIAEWNTEISEVQPQQSYPSSTSYKPNAIYKCIVSLIEILHI